MAWNIDIEATGRKLGAYKSAAKKVGCTLETWTAHRLVGNLWCTACRCWKREAQFRPDRTRTNGFSSKCKPCASKASTATRYGTSPKVLKRMEAEQGGRCLVCTRRRKLVVDHAHDTGRVRGLLCNRCNVGLGQFEDKPSLLRAAIQYLER